MGEGGIAQENSMGLCDGDTHVVPVFVYMCVQGVLGREGREGGESLSLASDTSYEFWSRGKC